MSGRGRELAARFKGAMDRAHEERLRAEEIRRERLERALEERVRLFADLEAFGRAIGHLIVERNDDRVTLRRGERHLTFDAMGEGERVRVSYEGIGDERHRLYREPALGGRWVWSRTRRGGEDRLPLFDAGLEALAIEALGLPNPEGRSSEDRGESTLEEAVPAPTPPKRNL